MKRRVLVAAAIAVAIAAFVGVTSTASATPTKTSRCTGCHSGAVTLTTTQTANDGVNATYSFNLTGTSTTLVGVAVFDGTTKVGSTITARTGSITVPIGKTYTVYGVQGPTTSDGLAQVSLTPTAPVAPPAPGDTTPPTTTSNAVATYQGSATILLSATDNAGGTGVATTYYVLDGGAQTAGTSVSTSVLGAHTLQFWSVDVAGNVETKKSVSFTILAAPITDLIAPVTTSNAVASYTGSATIKLTATDNAGGSGVATTYYSLDGGTVTAGTTVSTSVLGSHTLSFWSVDVAGNTEAAKSASFVVTAAPVTPPATGTVTCTLSVDHSSMHKGQTLRLHGTLSPASVGATAELWVKAPGSDSFVFVKNVTATKAANDDDDDDDAASTSAKWTSSYKVTKKGTYQFKVVFNGTSSRVKTVKVR